MKFTELILFLSSLSLKFLGFSSLLFKQGKCSESIRDFYFRGKLINYRLSESSKRSEYSGVATIGNSEALFVDLTSNAVNSAVLLLLITLLPCAETAAPAIRADIGFHQGRDFKSFF